MESSANDVKTAAANIADPDSLRFKWGAADKILSLEEDVFECLEHRQLFVRAFDSDTEADIKKMFDFDDALESVKIIDEPGGRCAIVTFKEAESAVLAQMEQKLRDLGHNRAVARSKTDLQSTKTKVEQKQQNDSKQSKDKAKPEKPKQQNDSKQSKDKAKPEKPKQQNDSKQSEDQAKPKKQIGSQEFAHRNMSENKKISMKPLLKKDEVNPSSLLISNHDSPINNQPVVITISDDSDNDGSKCIMRPKKKKKNKRKKQGNSDPDGVVPWKK